MNISLEKLTTHLRAYARAWKTPNARRDWVVLMGGFALLVVAVLVLGSYWLFALNERYALPPEQEHDKDVYEIGLDARTLEEVLETYEQRDARRRALFENGAGIVDPSL